MQDKETKTKADERRETLTPVMPTKPSLLNRSMKLILVLLVASIAMVYALAPRETVNTWSALIGLLIAIAFVIGMYLLISKIGTTVKKESVVIPPLLVTREEEQALSSSLIIKLLANHLFVGIAAPLSVWLVITLISHDLPIATIRPWTYAIYYGGLRLVLVFMGIYAVAAKSYALKSGVLLSIDSDSLAKKYLLASKEVGLRKLLVWIVLLCDVPFRFGVGWLFIAGPYWFFSFMV